MSVKVCSACDDPASLPAGRAVHLHICVCVSVFLCVCVSACLRVSVFVCLRVSVFVCLCLCCRYPVGVAGQLLRAPVPSVPSIKAHVTCLIFVERI